MIDKTLELCEKVFDHLGDAVIALHEGNYGAASLKLQATNVALKELMVLKDTPGFQNPIMGAPMVIEFMMGGLSVVVQMMEALKRTGDPEGRLPLCQEMLDTFHQLADFMDMQIQIHMPEDDDGEDGDG